jgi:uncharacterized membrane protein YqhA
MRKIKHKLFIVCYCLYMCFVTYITAIYYMRHLNMPIYVALIEDIVLYIIGTMIFIWIYKKILKRR